VEKITYTGGGKLFSPLANVLQYTFSRPLELDGIQFRLLPVRGMPFKVIAGALRIFP